MARELLAGSATSLEVDLAGTEALDARLPPRAGHELVQIAREALSNVARHSAAKHASLQLSVTDDIAELRIEDDGTGFDPQHLVGATHFGLANLRDRAAAVGGSLTVDSEPEKGTRIIVRLPIAAPVTIP
jgi:signal transduction histidine kinase